MTPRTGPQVVIGVGNRWRGDDGAGPELARRLRRLDLPPELSVLERDGDPASLLDAFDGADRALVADCVASGSAPGTLHRFEPADGPLPAELFRSSTHLLGLAEAIELARELGRLPRELVVYGIEGESFGPGQGLTPAVSSAVVRLASRISDGLGDGGAGDGRRAPSGAGA
ncbi:MAG: hydrogenase maturation protease [Solirubrobacterales bacterium]|nr:hydrogenase maturation protease [Solirubrobacterales bacterium]